MDQHLYRKTCVNNLRLLEAAAAQAAIEMNHAGGAVIARGTISDNIVCRSRRRNSNRRSNNGRLIFLSHVGHDF